jgi:intracellular septation protein A
MFVVGFVFCIVFGQFTFNLIRIILIKIKDAIVSTVAKIVYTLRFISAYVQALVNKMIQKILKCTKNIKKRLKKPKNRDSDTKEEDDKDGKGAHQKLTEESAEV